MDDNSKIRKIIKTTLQEFINEQNIFDNPEYAKIVGTDEELLHQIDFNLELANEMPEEMYNYLSPKHKKMYRERMLEFGGPGLANSENKSLIEDLVKYHFDKFEYEILDWIDMYHEMGNTEFPMSANVVNTLDEITQGRILQRLINNLTYKVKVDKQIFNSLNKNIQLFILKYPKIFVVG
jgi:hypothetical protein